MENLNLAPFAGSLWNIARLHPDTVKDDFTRRTRFGVRTAESARRSNPSLRYVKVKLFLNRTDIKSL